MKIRVATINDLIEIENIYNIANKHMNDEGNTTQWNDFEIFKQGVINFVKNNNFFVVEDKKEIVGIFALIYGIDITYNDIRKGVWINNDPYVTIHKIAVKYYQKHIASFILNFIINEIKQKDIYNIRIDTHNKNKSMKTFLLKHNFIYCGEISINCNFNDLNSLRDAYLKEL